MKFDGKTFLSTPPEYTKGTHSSIKRVKSSKETICRLNILVPFDYCLFFKGIEGSKNFKIKTEKDRLTDKVIHRRAPLLKTIECYTSRNSA